jgi:hypothetical protein
MSAFLVDKTTISKILTEIERSSRNSEWFKVRMAKELLVDFSDPQWQTHLGQKMLDLNQEALSHRYGDPKRRLRYTFQPVPCTKIQAFKALQCWLYQCAEGNIPEVAKLYKFFDKILIPEWAEYLVMRTAEYDAAEWG